LKKKVTLFINSLTSGGAERVLSVVIEELINQEIDVELFCIEQDVVYPLPKEVKVTYLSTLHKDDSGIKKLLYLPYLALKLKKYIKEREITLIQSHIYRANFINLLAKAFGAKHKVEVVEVTSISNLKDGGFATKMNFFLIQLLYRYADLIIFKAQKMREEFLKSINYSGETLVINNPYNIEKIRLLSEQNVDDFEFQESKKYMITVGRLAVEKRQVKLIEGLIGLDDNIELIIIGEGDEKASLQQVIDEYGLSSRVHLLGKKENPFRYVAKSDLFLLSSSGEGFPNVLVEAMICGVPVISTDCISGPREILAPDTDIGKSIGSDIELAEYGILYPIDNNKLLVKAITQLLYNRELHESYREKGARRAEDYALLKIIKEYKGALCVA
jgi:N-acetylgalactosamine-N,N'-diacetylbacillosaminyl-diphospho-undecaprenol 4-alpha-N-acetylgalactosaminyltransferase